MVIQVELSQQEIYVSKDNCLINKASVEDVKEFYCINIGFDVQANDSTCYLIVFDSFFWVVPDNVRGSYYLDEIIKINKNINYIEACVDFLPFSWRRNKFFFGMEAQYAVRKNNELVSFKKKIEG